jgi:polyisoprenoid-binding protein YceI
VSRFVVTANASQLRALARSTVHPFNYQAPVTGSVDANVRDGRFDVAAPITASFEVDLDDLQGDDPRADREMRRRLDVQRYPRAKASVHEVTWGDGDSYRLRGELSLHGKTRPLEGSATVTLVGDQLRAIGSLTIDIRDFGIKPPSLLVLRVHPEVEIAIDLIADLDTDLDTR